MFKFVVYHVPSDDSEIREPFEFCLAINVLSLRFGI